MNQDQSGIFAEQSNLSYSHYLAMQWLLGDMGLSIIMNLTCVQYVAIFEYISSYYCSHMKVKLLN